MADQEKNKNEDLENIEPVLDEDSFSLDLDDFDMGDDDMDVSPGIEAPNLEDISAFDDEDDSISDMVASSDTYDDLLDIDLDSDLNLLGEEDPILHDEDIHADFSDYEEESEKEQNKTPKKTKQSYNNANDTDEDDLELEFDDDLIDLDKEIESILNGEDGILTSKKSKQDSEEEEEGPISLSLEELENITGDLEEEDHSGESERSHFDEEEHALIDEDSDLDLDLDDSEIDTNLSFDEEGKPQFDLTDHDAEDSFIPKDDLGPGTAEEDTSFKPLVDPEEEELFGKTKEDENLTLSDEELGSILGAGGEASLEETLGSEEEFLTSDDESDLPNFSDDEDSSFDLLGGDLELPEEEPSNEEEDEGPLTLSLEELENISGGAIEEDFEEPTADILNEELEDESITLSPDELGNIIAGDPIEESDDSDMEETHELETDLGDDFGFDLGEPESDLEESESSEEGLEGQLEGFESSEEEDEGPIALSMEELESIASDAEESSEEELVDSFDRAPLPYEEELTPKSDVLAEEEEGESIALSMEELENITASEEEEMEQEDVTLSPESLDEILGEELPGEGLEDIADLPIEEEFSLSEQIGDEEPSDFDLNSIDEQNLVEHEDEMDFGDLTSDSTVDDSFDLTVNEPKDTRVPTLASDDSEEFEVDLDEYAMEGKLSPLEELRKSDISAPDSKQSSTEVSADVGEENLSVGERKKVLGYLDNLLGNLPDDVIQEFSKSQYFELYKKMMKELEL
ncbi:hypothetical protein [Leptospira vanthielii]|uniref:Uncharacterized protein n=1 Tax=Leptospira vanthielii serovar Holland str. Waz Holland = ATCC 700522 TaxID=1218591 RepID=N1VZ63_9LEPT|nr:hypothetical protein [Leptospira vanthielii]EMY69269.1 hypothetical protein LEP1GSC199_4154 [Leptospira vanthielii serovar Holland str. Waz Holland = ATCC 700522]